MALFFVKKEEPVDYALVSTNNDEDDANDIHSMDTYTITMKEEPTNDYKEYHNAAETECGSNEGSAESEYALKSEYASESESKDESLNDNESNEDSSKSSKCKFKCDKCSAVFKRKFSLKEHLKKHETWQNMDFCNICRKFVPRSYWHTALHNGPPYLCMICNKEFLLRKSFRIHKKVHQEKKYECDVCHSFYRSKTLLKSHMEIHIKREKTFQCHLCQMAFFRRNTLLRHIRDLHATAQRQKYKCQNTSCNREYFREHTCRSKRPPVKRVKIFNCTFCEAKFSKKIQRTVHVKQIHCENSKHFYCVKCKKTFRDFHYFVLHVENCPDKITYKCDMCSKVMKAKYHLVTHFSNYHEISALRTHKCNQCDKKFANETTLKLHVRVHENKLAINTRRAFECKYCSQVFRFNYSCKNHMQKVCTYRKSFEDDLEYKSDQKFICHDCGYTFKFKCGITEHMNIVHSNDTLVDNKYTCNMNKKVLRQYPCCNENYIGDTWNQRHVKTEKCQFKCKMCRLHFANFYALLRHCVGHKVAVRQSLRHLQDCRKCNKIFNWKCSVPEHLRGEKEESFKCEFCQKTYKYKAFYNSHVNKCQLKT